jgi:hypothetical protein
MLKIYFTSELVEYQSSLNNIMYSGDSYMLIQNETIKLNLHLLNHKIKLASDHEAKVLEFITKTYRQEIRIEESKEKLESETENLTCQIHKQEVNELSSLSLNLTLNSNIYTDLIHKILNKNLHFVFSFILNSNNCKNIVENISDRTFDIKLGSYEFNFDISFNSLVKHINYDMSYR